MADLTQSRPPQLGEQHSYTLNPQPGVGCEVVWSIDGQAVGVGDEAGGLKVVGIGASGTITVEVTDDTSDTEISAVIECPGVPPDPTGAFDVGGGGGGDDDDDKDVDASDVVLQILKTLILPATLPYWLIWFIAFLIMKLLKALGLEPLDLEDIKRDLKQVGHLLPDWLRNLLDL